MPQAQILQGETMTKIAEEKDRKGDFYTELDVHLIVPNPLQSRTVFNKSTIKSLARSIQKRGLLNPISVRHGSEGKYIIVHGERRWRACKLIGLKTIPVIVRKSDYTHDDLAIDQLIENVCREDLNVIEKSQGIESLLFTIPCIKRLPREERHNACISILGLTKKAFETDLKLPKPTKNNYFYEETDLDKCWSYLKMIGCSYNTAFCHIKVLELPREVRNLVAFGRQEGTNKKSRKTLPFRIGYELSRLNNTDLQINLAKRILENNWTSMRVKQTVDTVIEKNMEDYGFKYRSMKMKYRDYGMENLSNEMYDLATKIVNWRRLCLKRINCVKLDIDKKVGLELLKKATNDLKMAVEETLEGEQAVEKRNRVLQQKEFIAPFGGSDNRIAIPSPIIKSYGVPSFRNKENRKAMKHAKKWKIRVQIKEVWEHGKRCKREKDS